MSAKKKGQSSQKKGFFDSLNCASGKSEAQPIMIPKKPPMERKDANDPHLSHEVITVKAFPGHGPKEEVEVSYSDVKVIGKGTFGVVYRARLLSTDELVAIKKVFHSDKYKNRELQLLTSLEHPNIVALQYYFFATRPGKQNEMFLNMIMDYMPATLWSIAQCDGTNKPLLDLLYVKLYMYQLFRCLMYLHSFGIAHRDVKPQNLLLNPETHVIKLCDFGSAKELVKGESNVSYICSRYYRAPELILGAENYTVMIDVWSGGCVLAELLLGQPIFPGATAADQLVEIIKVIGTPTPQDFNEINPNFQNTSFPHLRAQAWHKVLYKSTTTPDAVDLISKILVYQPSHRLSAIDVIAHPFFDELRNPQTRLHNRRKLPPLFDFSEHERSIKPELNDHLIPLHVLTGESDIPDVEELDIRDEADDDVTESSPTHDNTANASFSDKLRQSFSKASKRISGMMKTPMKSMKRSTSKEPKAEDGVHEAGTDAEAEVDVEAEAEGDVTEERNEDHSLEEVDAATLEDEPTFDANADVSVPVDEEVEISAVVKKKKKKKKPKAVQPPPEDDDELAAEIQEPVSYSEDPAGFGDDVDTDMMSGDQSVEMSMNDEQEEVIINGDGDEFQQTVVITKVTKTKKTRRKVTKRQVEMEPEVTDDL